MGDGISALLCSEKVLNPGNGENNGASPLSPSPLFCEGTCRESHNAAAHLWVTDICSPVLDWGCVSPWLWTHSIRLPPVGELWLSLGSTIGYFKLGLGAFGRG